MVLLLPFGRAEDLEVDGLTDAPDAGEPMRPFWLLSFDPDLRRVLEGAEAAGEPRDEPALVLRFDEASANAPLEGSSSSLKRAACLRWARSARESTVGSVSLTLPLAEPVVEPGFALEFALESSSLYDLSLPEFCERGSRELRSSPLTSRGSDEPSSRRRRASGRPCRPDRDRVVSVPA